MWEPEGAPPEHSPIYSVMIAQFQNVPVSLQLIEELNFSAFLRTTMSG